MEEQSVGELPQCGRPLGVHDLSGGTVFDVGSGRVKRSSPLAVAKGLELDRNSFWYRFTDKSNRWGSSTGKDTTSASTK